MPVIDDNTVNALCVLEKDETNLSSASSLHVYADEIDGKNRVYVSRVIGEAIDVKAQHN